MVSSYVLLFFTAALALYIMRLRNRKNRLPLPPGPRGMPIFGNVSDMPPKGCKEWEHWLKHKDIYGPVSSVTIMGQPIVLLNDAKNTVGLLEKQAARNSGRPTSVFVGEMVGWGNLILLQNDTSRVRAYRRRMSHMFSTKALAVEFPSVRETAAGHFIFNVLEKPEELQKHIRVEIGAIILRMVYGYNVDRSKPDALVQVVEKALAEFSLAATPGAWLVDLIPPLRYLPDWFPGTRFKQIAREWSQTRNEMVSKPYAFVLHQMAHKRSRPCYVSKQLEQSNYSPTPEEEDEIKWSAAALYGAGGETTVSPLSCFFLAMAVNPPVQRKAHEEIDRVIGPDRLPTIADRDRLPYLNAILREVSRWHPVAPLGFPHLVNEDDVYAVYGLPKGTIIIPNIWAITHDPETYHNPMEFNPERFIESEGHQPEPDPDTIGFGFGRRVCPGRAVAETTQFLMAAYSLAVFDTGKVVENGQEVQPEIDFTSSMISHPIPYRIDVRPRNAQAEALIRVTEAKNPVEEGDADIWTNLDWS